MKKVIILLTVISFNVMAFDVQVSFKSLTTAVQSDFARSLQSYSKEDRKNIVFHIEDNIENSADFLGDRLNDKLQNLPGEHREAVIGKALNRLQKSKFMRKTRGDDSGG